MSVVFVIKFRSESDDSIRGLRQLLKHAWRPGVSQEKQHQGRGAGAGAATLGAVLAERSETSVHERERMNRWWELER
jgi:hypothetical protein